jgi:hypothetical protein
VDLIEFLQARLDEDEAAIREDAGLGLAYGWPARLLAEVEAKRAILAHWTSDAQFPDFHGGYEEAMNDAALALAQPYADHPDFDPAWLLTPA